MPSTPLARSILAPKGCAGRPEHSTARRTVRGMPARFHVRLLAATLGLIVGPLSPSSEAEALVCDDFVGETLELQLRALELDDQTLELDAPLASEFAWIERVRVDVFDDEQLLLQGPDMRSETLALDMRIEPSPEVAAHILESEQRTRGGVLCSDTPYAAAEPGEYLVEASELWPADASATLEAERRVLRVALGLDEELALAEFEVIDASFPGDGRGCSVSDQRGSAGPWALALLALLAWRRRD